jgi:ribose/xylose/arabinose/galactoside ABC-type transport system permease subunit
MLYVLIALIIITAILAPSFLNIQNIMNIFRQSAVMGFVALGMSFVILGGSFDMSVGSIVTLSGILAVSLQPFVGLFWAIVLTLAVGMFIGLINGLIIAGIKGTQGDSFIVTFGMLTLIQAIALIITNGTSVVGSNDPVYVFIGNGDIGVVPFSIILFTVFAIIMQIFISKTLPGRKIYYMGENSEVARLCGINIKAYKIFTYMISGAMSAIGAIIMTARVNGATPKAGAGLLFPAITAIVVGGILLKGGEGSIIHTVIGVLIMGVISNSMNMIGISSQNQLIVKGIILIAAVCMGTIKKKGFQA